MKFDSLKPQNLYMFFRLEEVKKSAVEGIYADTPANRKLGRVGMSYASYAEKTKQEGEQKEEKKEPTKSKPTKEEFTKQVKSYIQQQIDTLGKNNDYINLSTQEGCSIRLIRGAIGSKNKDIEGKFVKAFVKDPQGKIRKFELASYDELVTSLSNYMYENNYSFEEVKEEKKESQDTDSNKNILQDTIDNFKKENKGTAVLTGTGGVKIYLGRKLASRWYKDFDSCTVRDTKSNVLFQLRGVKSESDLVEKLSNYLAKHNIKIDK